MEITIAQLQEVVSLFSAHMRELNDGVVSYNEAVRLAAAGLNAVLHDVTFHYNYVTEDVEVTPVF